MADNLNTKEKNIFLQGVTDKTITILVDGQTQEIEKKLDTLQALMEQMASNSIQSANNIYNIGSITNANFGYLMGQVGLEKSLPTELANNLVGEGNGWTQSLRQELVKQGIAVGNQPISIFQNYGWLVQIFLQKMGTAVGQEKNLRRLSFMTESYQASLRYLCYIQLAQVIQLENKPKQGIISDFIQMDGNTESSLFGTGIYLQNQRQNLMRGTLSEDDKLPELLDEYLTALAYWLRKLSFLAKYRLVSIKDIHLDYRLGTAKNFVHQYGELHGIYTEGDSAGEDYNSKSIADLFTYNKSILLFKGTDIATCMDNIQNPTIYLCLSPLLIDQSVYTDKLTQTPEIYYYSGFEKARRGYHYMQYKNELAFGGKEDVPSNKTLEVLEQNNNQSLLDELFVQLEDVFKSVKIKKV